MDQRQDFLHSVKKTAATEFTAGESIPVMGNEKYDDGS